MSERRGSIGRARCPMPAARLRVCETFQQSSFPRIHGENPAHENPQPSFPRRRESTGGGRRWVPVCTGTTGGDGRTHNRHSHNSGNPRQPQSSFPRRRESTGGPAMGSRLHGNDGRRRAHPQSSAGIHGPTIVIPATAGIHGGGPAMGSRLHGNDGRRRRTHNRRRESTHPQPSFPRRRESTAGGRRWVPVCTGTTGGGGRTHNRRRESTAPQSSFPRRRESTGGPAMGSRLHGNDGRRRRTHNRRRESTAPQSSFPRRRESTGGPAMGSRLHGNDGRRRAHPQSSARIHGPTIVIPATAGIHGGGRRWVPVCTGTTGGGGVPTIVGENPRPHNRHSREGGNPRRGAGGGWVPVCTGTTGGGGAATPSFP